MRNLIVAYFILLSLPAFNGNKPDLEKILSEYYLKNGKDAQNTWQELMIRGEASAGNMNVPVLVNLIRPDKLTIEMVINGEKTIIKVDGKKYTVTSSLTGNVANQFVGDDFIRSASDMADFEGPLYKWKEKGYKAKYIGRYNIDGKDFYVIRLKNHIPEPEYFYISADDFLLTKVITTGPEMKPGQEDGTVFKDYKSLSGAMFPYTIESFADGKLYQKFKVTEITVNPK